MIATSGTWPAELVGPNAQLAKYNNAKELLKYITDKMPANTPNSLTGMECLQVLCYILIQNKLVTTETSVDVNQLQSIALK